MYRVCLMHARADRVLRLLVANRLEEFDLTMMEWLLLATVCTAPREGMTMTAVAEALDVTLPQVTALANSLVKTKLVKQRVSSKDRRSRYLIATITGKRLIARVEESVNQSEEDWFKDIPHDKLLNYIDTVEQLANLPTDKQN